MSAESEDRRMTFRGSLDGPRWAGAASALKTTCWNYDVEYVVDEEKHFLSTTIRFELKGKLKNIRKVVRWMDDVIESYNAL
jgi:hypothetical protein